MLTRLRLGCASSVRFAHGPRFTRSGSPPRGRQRVPARRSGEAKGTPNKVNQSIREAIQMAFEQAGGVEYLVRLAQEGGLNIHIELT
jgi:hypothetical protein